MIEQNLTENLEKIVAILDVLLYRIRKLKRNCENDSTMALDAKELILKTFDGVIRLIEKERNQFEDGALTVYADYPEDRAIGYAQFILQMGRQSVSENVVIQENRAQVLGVFAAIEKIITELKQERGLEDVLVTGENEIVEGTVRFSLKGFEIPDTSLTYEECVARIAQIEWIVAHYEGVGYEKQYLSERLPDWYKMKDQLKLMCTDMQA